MKLHFRHASPASVALTRSEPDTALTTFWLVRQVTLSSTDSVRLYYQMHHRRRGSHNLTAPRRSRMSLVRSAHLYRRCDSASMRPMLLAVQSQCDGSKKIPPVAVNPGEAPGITVPIKTGFTD
jgi:hypothetical protein